eukprot:Gregarina_sp_Pseudo_9__4812@NODE_502_length_2690_cov_180_804979_g473_i0_p2_GENE_NODE_502_length_2690_cov_180_804979_g473_i0NODE_502_length_2690_cov_180_804979_g473_i0_p2_ORF_typecomplete_len146_score17_81_NODE_502_length_2690_cov_180_804979_g473_i097534
MSVITTETERERRERLARWQEERLQSQSRWAESSKVSQSVRFHSDPNWRDSTDDFTAFGSSSHPASPRSPLAPLAIEESLDDTTSTTSAESIAANQNEEKPEPFVYRHVISVAPVDALPEITIEDHDYDAQCCQNCRFMGLSLSR